MRFLFCVTLISSFNILFAQKKVIKTINNTVTAASAEAHLTFLSADEMRGRDTGSPELEIAANYLATQFSSLGVKPANGTSYFQEVNLDRLFPAKEAELVIGSTSLRAMDDLALLSGTGGNFNKEIIFLGFGAPDDFEKSDVKDKIVVTFTGNAQTKSVAEAFLIVGPLKRQLAERHGAIALIEILSQPGVPWNALAGRFKGNRMVISTTEGGRMPHLWMRNADTEAIKSLLESKKATGTLNLETIPPVRVKTKNVLGIIEGKDDKLKSEFIAVTAHYDHVGVKKGNGLDSIYNGARDNAIGTTALLEAAKFFSANRPKRSILFIALTAEEVGLLGSNWYANHPVIPLKQTVFNFNCDGGGYNDTTSATVIDFNRTTADELMKKGCANAGLTLNGDPAPEQGFYERSDNVNFAMKGVPAVNISPGIKTFDQELLKYYHQPADEVNSLNMHYLGKFYRAFVYTLFLLTDTDTPPAWKAGDKFEPAGKTLYSK